MIRLLTAAALFSFAVLPAAFGAKAKTKPGPEVLVVADASESLTDDLKPAPGKPVHYIILGSAERTLGAAIAGEPIPDRATVEAAVARALAEQGYVRTQLGGPIPQLAIVISFGSANLMIDEIASTDDSGATTTSDLVWNSREIAMLVGADKANRRFLMSSEADALNDAARQDRAYLLVAAFDIPALRKKEKKILWRLRISIESLRHSLPDSLNLMLASAVPYIGKDTEMPVFIDDTLRRKADVQIGIPVVVPETPKPAADDKAKK